MPRRKLCSWLRIPYIVSGLCGRDHGWRGSYVRSEAEFQSIMAQLQGGDKQAVIPPMLVGPHQAPPFLDDNGRVHDCAALLRERQVQMRWP